MTDGPQITGLTSDGGGGGRVRVVEPFTTNARQTPRLGVDIRQADHTQSNDDVELEIHRVDEKQIEKRAHC